MGGRGSRVEVFDEPWRNAHWGDTTNLEFIQQFKPECEGIRHLRILLYGPVGAGKSSFINSMKNAILQRNTHSSLANASNWKTSFTETFKTHRIRKGRSKPKEDYPFVFNDIMGLESNHGVHPDDIKLVLKGHVKEGYTFKPAVQLSTSDPNYVSAPAADDKVHVLVCVLNANAPNINTSVLQKMDEVRKAASEMGIPQLAILTNIDGACGEIKKDLRRVYRSMHLKKKMMDYSSAIGIPMNCFFPVQNYFEEDEVNGGVDTLILNALKQMICFGVDFLDTLD